LNTDTFINENKNWSEDEIQFLKNNYTTMSYKRIGELLGRTDGAIRAKMHDLQLIKKTFWSEDELTFLKENYQLLTYKELSEHLQRSEDAIQLKLRKIGLSKTPYTCDVSFFDEIDNEYKAYWLGFLYADGYVIINKATNSGTVGIDLQRNDKSHLLLFNKSINGNYKIDDFVKIINDTECNMSRIRIYSRKMADSLISHGCIENKSLIMTFPSLPDHLYPHFIRGYFDGDGCISKNSNVKNDLSINFTCGSLSFIQDLRTFLYQKSIFSYICKEKDKNTYRLYIKGLANVDNLWNYMYSNCSIFLYRKYDKKFQLYETYNIAHRLPRMSEMT